MPPPSPSEITVVVAYPSTDPKTSDAIKFNMPYYLSTHMPLIDKVWGPHGMLRWSITEFPDPDPFSGQAPPYRVQTTLHWKSVEDFKAAMGDEGSKVTGEDVKNFSNVWPVIWVGTVTGSQGREEMEENMKNVVYGQAGL